MVVNRYVGLDLTRVLDKLSLINFIETTNPAFKVDDASGYVFVKFGKKVNYPKDLLMKRITTSKSVQLYSHFGYGVASPFAAEVLRANRFIREHIRCRLVEELKELEQASVKEA